MYTSCIAFLAMVLLYFVLAVPRSHLYIFLYRENRYLLFLTENYAALQVLKRYLQEAVGLPALSRSPAGGAGGLEAPSVEDKAAQQRKRDQQRKMEPFVLFGSSFPKDMIYTQVLHIVFIITMMHNMNVILCSGVS